MKLSKFLIEKYWEESAKTTKKIILGQPKFDNIVETCNIQYCSDNDVRHTLNIFYAKNVERPQTVILDIHGGGWFFGEKKINDGYCKDMASRGFTVVNVDYTLAPTKSVKEQIKEIDDAMIWVENNIKNYFGDINKLVISGDSAGGYLAMAYTAIKSSVRNAEKYNVAVNADLIKACVVSCGIFDFSFYLKSPIPLAYNYMKMILKEDFNRKQDVSSIAYLIDGGMPPIFMSSSEQDIFRRQSVNYSKILDEKNIEHTFVYSPKGVNGYPLEHVFNIMKFYLPESKELNSQVVDFINATI